MGVLRVGLVLSLVLFGAVPLCAQTGTVRGSIVDSEGNRLAGATIGIDGLFRSAVTDANGEYRLTDVPAGSRTIRVRVLGYQTATRTVTVGPGETVEASFTLEVAPIALAPIEAVVGSRARHTAVDELAVPVDVYPAEELVLQGNPETSQILQSLSPSVNFPHQSVTDANDIVRPFTLRGLSPDHTLVLINGLRRHQTAVVNTFAYGTGAGSSGVDLNAIPSSAIDRIEVLRDGASAQYGSDAIAGVVNIVLKEGRLTPFANVHVGRYIPDEYTYDGTTISVNGGWGAELGRGSLGLFAEFLERDPTNRAWADPFATAGTGVADSIDADGDVVVKRNPVPQPTHRWGDGLERDVLTMANFRYPLTDARTTEVYAFGGYSYREGTGNGYFRYSDSGRNWPQIYPLGFLPEFNPDVEDYSVAAGFRAATAGWTFDVGGGYGRNDFEYNMRNTLNASLGPCLALGPDCGSPAPGPDGTVGTADDMANQTSFFAGRLSRDELTVGFNAARPLELGLREPVNLAFGAQFRRERFEITSGELASYIHGGHPDQFGDEAPAGSQVFPGFAPTDETDEDRTNFGVYADLETNLTPEFLANLAGRFESYSDFGELITGKLAFRYQPSERVTLRAAGSTGFRAPGVSQVHFSKIVTNVIAGEFIDVGIFPVDHPASRLLGAEPLQEETALNLSAGFAVSPRDNLNITADYFYITIDDRILLGATFDDQTTVDILTGGGFTNIGGVQYFTNGLDTETQGIDVTARYETPVGPAGRLGLTGVVNYTRNEITRVDPLPAVLQGSTEPGIIDSVTWIAIEDERPDWRWTGTAEYEVGRFHTLGRASYFGGFSSAQPGFCDLCRDSYGAKTLFDAELGYRFDQIDLSVGVRNLFDTFPDRPSSQVVVDEDGSTAKDFNDNFGIFPWAAASPFGYNGRYIYTRASIQLGW